MPFLFKESSPGPRSVLKSLPAAESRPVWTPEASTGRDVAKGKDFNTDLGAGLDSLNKKGILPCGKLA